MGTTDSKKGFTAEGAEDAERADREESSWLGCEGIGERSYRSFHPDAADVPASLGARLPIPERGVR
jgi:hypothetical protein